MSKDFIVIVRCKFPFDQLIDQETYYKDFGTAKALEEYFTENEGINFWTEGEPMIQDSYIIQDTEVTDPASEHKSVPKTSNPDYKLEIEDSLKTVLLIESKAGQKCYLKSYPKAIAQITHLIETEKKKARIDELYHLKYAFTEKKDEYLEKMLDLRIATIERQSEELQGGIDNE